MLFSTAAVPFCVPTSNTQAFQFLHIHGSPEISRPGRGLDLATGCSCRWHPWRTPSIGWGPRVEINVTSKDGSLGSLGLRSAAAPGPHVKLYQSGFSRETELAGWRYIYVYIYLRGCLYGVGSQDCGSQQVCSRKGRLGMQAGAGATN